MESQSNSESVIKSMEMLEQILQAEANKPKNYNTDWAFYLDQTAFQLRKVVADLKDLQNYMTW